MKPTSNDAREPGSLDRIVSLHGPTHLDLFSGIGGFALAARWTGWTTIAMSEIEPYACKILAEKFPGVPNLGDIRTVRGVTADLITGGFPCQPFSVAGERRGSSDDRHLWPEMRRVIGETRPAWVLAENVPGIIGLELDNVLADLEGLGYACWPVVVPACAVDARHRRDRVWIVAHCDRFRRETRGPRSALREEQEGRNGHRDGRPSLADTSKQLRTFNGRQAHEPGRGGEGVADADATGLEKLSEQPAREKCEAAKRSGEAGPCQWPTEPGMGRMVNGLPNRAHRLKGLGNAIVPQVAETLLRWMRQIHENVMQANEKVSNRRSEKPTTINPNQNDDSKSN